MASELRVTYEKASGGERQTGPGADLSLGGVFIETTKTLPVGALLSLEIEAGTTKVVVDARVLSLRPPGGPDKPGGMAVSFIDLPNDVASTLSFILATRTKRKGTMLGLGEAEDDVPQYESASRLPKAPARPAPPAAAAAAAPAAPAPIARPSTPVMDKKAEPASAPARHPTPPMMRSAPPSAPPSSLPSSHGMAVPTAPQAWGPPSSPPSAPPPISSPWGVAPPMAAPSPAAPGRGISPAALIVVGIVVFVAIAVVATFAFLGKLG